MNTDEEKNNNDPCPICTLSIKEAWEQGLESDSFCDDCVELIGDSELPEDFDEFVKDIESPNEKEKIKKEILNDSIKTYTSTALTPRWVKAEGYNNMREYLENNDPEHHVFIEGDLYSIG